MKLIKISFFLTLLCFGSLFCFKDVNEEFHHYFITCMTRDHSLWSDKCKVNAMSALHILRKEPENIFITQIDISYIKLYIKIPNRWTPNRSYDELWGFRGVNTPYFRKLCLAIVHRVGIDVLKKPELLNKIQ